MHSISCKAAALSWDKLRKACQLVASDTASKGKKLQLDFSKKDSGNVLGCLLSSAGIKKNPGNTYSVSNFLFLFPWS